MGLGVYFREDLAAILAAVDDAGTALTRARGIKDPQDAAYIAGYRAAIKAMAVSLGLPTTGARVLDMTVWTDIVEVGQ
ncbi:MAG: hypothetical protein KKA73_11455 [Chloroflexi bacterium]|nr:hypothetical protein [Chloroflexota bacterium]MBU1748295.1 hypothetical protein [Chloroflexota bacterium]